MTWSVWGTSRFPDTAHQCDTKTTTYFLRGQHGSWSAREGGVGLRLRMTSILDYKTYTGNFKMRTILLSSDLTDFFSKFQGFPPPPSQEGHTRGILWLKFQWNKGPSFLLASVMYTQFLFLNNQRLLFRKKEFPEEISQSLLFPDFWKHVQYLEIWDFWNGFFLSTCSKELKQVKHLTWKVWGLGLFRGEEDSLPIWQILTSWTTFYPFIQKQ